MAEFKIALNGNGSKAFFRVLANETCRKILNLLSIYPHLSVSALAKQIGITEASISYEVKHLIEVGLVSAKFSPGKHGVKKNVHLAHSSILIDLKVEIH